MRWMVISLVRQTGWTGADHVWCEKLATACSVMASVVKYLKYKYFKYVLEMHTDKASMTKCNNVKILQSHTCTT